MGAKGDSRVAGVGRRAATLAPSVLALRAAALALAALALFGVGCAKKDSGKRTVVFWQFSPLTAIQPIVDRFNAENPDLNVQVEQLTWQSGREKIVAAIAAGRPPDLCELGSTFLPGLVADSTLADLTDRVADLKPSLVGWNVASYRGRAYAIPWMLGTRALYLNDDLARRAGLDPSKPPETWADLARTARLISTKVPDAKGFGMNAGEREILIKKFMPFAWGNGGDILDSTLTKSVVASAANLAALRFYLSLKPYSLLDRQEMHEEAFAKGRLGIIISGPWLLRKLPEQAPELQYTVALMPKPAADHGTPASFAGAEVLGIFRNAKRGDDAMRLARFLVRQENSMPLFLSTGNAFPAAWASSADSYFVSHPKDAVFLHQLKTAVGPPLHPRWVEIEEIVNGELEEAIYGRKTAEAALASADARINAVLARRP
ncbi:MAG TPA: extracellular solute-binding protein [Candidatus Eisenbacteria bacterium]|nr:extracellular solute-binding protein [Candidatus Eisenbacteria bacterium]